MECQQLSAKNLDIAIERMKQLSEGTEVIKRNKEIARNSIKLQRFRDWLEKHCHDEKAKHYADCAVLACGAVPIPPYMYNALKPWIEKYDSRREKHGVS